MSFRFGLREGSLESKPNVKSDMKKITVVYTTIFSVNISFIYTINLFIFNLTTKNGIRLKKLGQRMPPIHERLLSHRDLRLRYNNASQLYRSFSIELLLSRE